MAEILEGKAVVISSADNGQDCHEIVAKLDRVIQSQPDVIHFNTALRDLAREKSTGKNRTSLEEYEANLQHIVKRMQSETKARLYFATTTPVIDARQAARRLDIDRSEADVLRYNEVAIRVMKRAGVPVAHAATRPAELNWT